MARALNVLVGVILYLVVATGLMGAGTQRSYTPGHFALELDGVLVGELKSAEGASIRADVVTEPMGLDHIQHKHVASVASGPLTLTLTPGMGQPLQQWIAGAVAGRTSRKSGSIVASDYNFRIERIVEFHNALITEVRIPSCDGSSKDPAYITIKLDPQSVTAKPGTGAVYSGLAKGKQKLWMAANFRFSLAGLNCSGVTSVDAIDIRAGGRATPITIKVTLTENTADSWRRWEQESLTQGHAGAQTTKAGAIEYLPASLGRPLWRLDLTGVGIRALTPVPSGGSAGLRRVRAELYCEHMEYSSP